MKKKIILCILAVCILLVLFLPLSVDTCDDGGTRVYSALAYKIVVWNKIMAEVNEDGSGGEIKIYHKTSVYWFPDSLKSIDALWKIERNGG